MKRIAAIVFCLLVAVAPVLALVPTQAVPVADDCDACACESMACCSENSESDSSNQPAAPVKSGKRHLSPASPQAVLVELPAVVERDAGIGHAARDSFLSFAAPIYTWNCAYLI